MYINTILCKHFHYISLIWRVVFLFPFHFYIGALNLRAVWACCVCMHRTLTHVQFDHLKLHCVPVSHFLYLLCSFMLERVFQSKIVYSAIYITKVNTRQQKTVYFLIVDAIYSLCTERKRLVLLQFFFFVGFLNVLVLLCDREREHLF